MSAFTLDLDRFKVKTIEQMDLVARKIALEAYRRVILKTPVKTGRARGNWQCTIGTPAAGTIEGIDPAGAKAMSTVQAQVAAWKAVSGVSILLTNNLPYIGRLEHGSSTQAPNGMVGVTIAELGGIVQEAL
jgi:hypothetical protein